MSRSLTDATAIAPKQTPSHLHHKRWRVRASLDIRRNVALHRQEHLKAQEALVLKYIDVVITERCWMKCADCSNFMQYYEAPEHADFDVLAESVRRIAGATIEWASSEPLPSGWANRYPPTRSRVTVSPHTG